MATIPVLSLPIPRDELKKFLPNFQLIKAFENMSQDVSVNLPDGINDNAAAVEIAQATADSAVVQATAAQATADDAIIDAAAAQSTVDALALRDVPLALVDGASIAVNATAHNSFFVTLGGNRALSAPTGLLDGMLLNFAIRQDVTGSRALTFAAIYNFGAAGAPVLSTTPGAVDYVSGYYDAGSASILCTFRKAQSLSAISPSAGQCILRKSGANLVLFFFQGNQLTINGVVQPIPSVGVSLSPAGATPDTNYYIYAYMNAGVMTLEYSTTGHTTDPANGVEIKTGDATRSLVGFARAVTGPAWEDSTSRRFVASWFNPVSRYLVGAFSASRATASATFVEVNTEIRVEWVQFANTTVDLGLNGFVSATVGSASTGVALDAVLQDGSSAATGTTPQPVSGKMSTIASEGYHFATLVGTAGGAGGTITYSGGANAASVRTSLQGTLSQ